MLYRECTLLPKWGGVTAFTYMYVRENAHFTVENTNFRPGEGITAYATGHPLYQWKEESLPTCI